jgi:hypothetical protein
VVEGVREELAAAGAAVDRPGPAATALALAAILDNPRHVPTQPAAARQLVAILDQLSKRTHRSGRLAVVRAMSGKDSQHARSGAAGQVHGGASVAGAVRTRTTLDRPE